MSLKGKTALLFGAGAIASGYTQLLVAEEMKIALVSRGQSAAQLAAQFKDNSGIIVLKGDSSDYRQVEKVYETAIEKLGHIDVVINGSGGNSPDATASDLEGILNIKAQAAQEMLANNYLAKWYSLQCYLRYLKAAGHTGSVVNITSMSGLTPLSKVIHYSAAFAAIENLTKSMAYVYGHYGYGRVNNLAVGFVIGEQNRRLLTNEDGTFTPRGQEIIAATSQHRFLTPEEIAPHVLYLADQEKSEVLNGITLRVDGGFGLIGLPQTGYN